MTRMRRRRRRRERMRRRRRRETMRRRFRIGAPTLKSPGHLPARERMMRTRLGARLRRQCVWLRRLDAEPPRLRSRWHGLPPQSLQPHPPRPPRPPPLRRGPPRPPRPAALPQRPRAAAGGGVTTTFLKQATISASLLLLRRGPPRAADFGGIRHRSAPFCRSRLCLQGALAPGRPGPEPHRRLCWCRAPKRRSWWRRKRLGAAQPSSRLTESFDGTASATTCTTGCPKS
mmetsp:Transcript_25164/g.57090  ORF Transcript_25164/g.57090 Transcript_25164/m.57090 type:complete len:230 (+) Transcript_25164:300-989(+)